MTPRSRGQLLAAVSSLDPANNSALQRRPLVKGGPVYTFCNWFVEQLLLAMEINFPGGMLARQQIQYLSGDSGRMDGWREVLELEAQKLAELGCPVVATWLNPDPTHSSHVAIVVPAIGATGTHIAQAGRTNFANGPIAAGFGVDKLPAVKFFHHP